MSNNQFLEELDTMWASAPVPENAQQKEVPDGSYTVKVQRCEWKESKNGKTYLSWGLVVDGGEHNGRWVWKKNFLANQQSLSFLKKDLNTLGLTLDKLSSFNPELVLDLHVEITKKTKPGTTAGDTFVEVYFNRLAGETTPEGNKVKF